MKWNKTEHWAPFFKANGNLLDYPSWNPEMMEWKEVSKPFLAALECIRFGRGRSSVTFIWKDVNTGSEYSMFVSDMFDLIKSGGIVGSDIVKGYWKVVKKGANYVIKYEGPPCLTIEKCDSEVNLYGKL